MIRFLLRRVAAAIGLIAVAGSLVFFAIRILPGDPALLLLGEQGASDPQVLAEMRHKLGTDRPLPEQYVRWLGNVVTLRLGTSLTTGLPVSAALAARIPRSLELIVGGAVLAVAFGIPLGVAAARRTGGVGGPIIAAVGTLGLSAPSFVIGVLLVIAFSLEIGGLPSGGYAPVSDGWGANLSHAVLPCVTLAAGFMGMVLRVTRASVRETLRRDFVRNLRARGLGEQRVIYRHAVPNSLIPVVAVIGVRIGSLLGGTVVVENLFNWPGLSSLLVDSCTNRDFPMIEGCLLSIFVLFAVLTLFVDLVLRLLDPRIAYD